ncbi:Rv1733c family protein [Kutzneria kofuensis]|uniref:Uncharacterized protein n=1 Tax=Kutzneria kofuensis TaxID=103725 RepID=A0A7W9NLF9_9PSEU|nr:hypothetical protein [Kutzneria kofuensis]MBB5896724.1 hypothetical protein [Kutzneria kofuensis]
MGTYVRQVSLLGMARRIGLGRNSLRRPVDRVEGLSVVLVWLAGMVIALAGIVFGLTVAQSDLVTSGQQMARSHPTNAVRLDNSLPGPGSTGTRMSVQVRYTDQASVVRTGWTEQTVGLTDGASVRVWLDDEGSIVPPPMTPDDAVVNGVVAGSCGAVGAEGLVLAAYLFARWRMDHRKFAAIDLEWAQLSAR